MNARGWYLVGMLALLFLANLFMLMGMTNWPQRVRENFAAHIVAGKPKSGAAEGFMDMLSPGGFATAPIGSYDGRNMAADLPPAAQGFRRNRPDEPLAGPPIEVGPDNLFIFANNQCKPECCGATLSCDGGCVCSTPQQRAYLNARGGNRLHGDI
jgi:hypothetical protein